MIPLKLQIKNFLSYGADVQTIEFGQYPLICLSGKNGHGKSALLDAITWTIWGQARKLMGNAKADQGLLRLGQTQMMVCLDFECGGQLYRIKREFMQTYGKPVAILDFGLFDRNTEQFISLTEKTIRDTQAKIDNMLHLTFDAFINSAFLRQGQANEFSKKTAKERKEVLASILGLDRYENIRRLAAERIKQSNTYKLHLVTLNTKLEEELAKAPIIEQQLNALTTKQQEITAQEQAIALEKKELENEAHILQEKKQKIAMVAYQQEQSKNEQENSHSKLREIFTQWRSIHKQNLKKIDYGALEHEKKEILNAIKLHQQALQDQLTLKQEFLTYKEQANHFAHQFHEKKSQEINTKKIAIERLIAEQNHVIAKINDTNISQTRNQQECSAYTQELTILSNKPNKNNQQSATLEKQFEKRKEHYQRWITQANMLSTELVTIDQKNKLVHDEESPSCPLCEQNLSAARKRFLKKKFEDNAQFLKQRFTRLSNLIKKLKTILIDQHALLEQIKKDEQQAQLEKIKIDEISKTIAKYQNDKADLVGALAKYQELQTILQSTIQAEQKSLQDLLLSSKKELETIDDYQKIQKKLSEIEKMLAEHTYNSPAYEQATRQLNHIEKQLIHYRDLQEQQLFQTQRTQQINTLCIALKSLKKEIALQEQKLLEMKTIESNQDHLIQRHKQLETKIREIVQQKELVIHEKGSLENQRQKLEQTKQEKDLQEKELKTCSAIIDDYQAIAQATGKDGIQALLIEDAIPEIEHEANELLAKLTDNQTQLFIESLRDLKKGGTKETLDIRISDAAGIRAYELFSGGEAFRIDFALRIAISKLLARRAGTSLQTLIIDEGFGSQDEDGLSHIMDAIYKIQEDFAKIIIVSHLTSMKNQFPVHFIIEKGPQGSMVEIMEQG